MILLFSCVRAFQAAQHSKAAGGRACVCHLYVLEAELNEYDKKRFYLCFEHVLIGVYLVCPLAFVLLNQLYKATTTVGGEWPSCVLLCVVLLFAILSVEARERYILL